MEAEKTQVNKINKLTNTMLKLYLHEILCNCEKKLLLQKGELLYKI